MILKQKAFQKLFTNYETKGKPRKIVISRYQTRFITKTQCAWSETVYRLRELSMTGAS